MYETIDSILNGVEGVLRGLMEKRDLTSATVERWRWDQPVITLTWMGQDDINLNIHGLVVGENGEALAVDLRPPSLAQLRIEANAWMDKDIEGGKQRVRNWKHHLAGVVTAVNIDGVTAKVSEAYEQASTWKVADLKDPVRIRSASA